MAAYNPSRTNPKNIARGIEASHVDKVTTIKRLRPVCGPILPGSRAPGGILTDPRGKTERLLAALRHKRVLLWFVAPPCPSCRAGTRALAGHLSELSALGVTVVELELFQKTGSRGPDIGSFGRRYAGAAFGNPQWVWGTASKWLSARYDPHGDRDVYYLIDPRGRVRYVNHAPARSMQALLQIVPELPETMTG